MIGSCASFLHGHATHPDWRLAMSLSLAQIDAQMEALVARQGDPEHDGGMPLEPLTLGWCYLTDHYAGAAELIFEELRRRCPGVAWVGAVGVGVVASGVEYIDEPAMVLMLGALPRESFRVFSGQHPLLPGGGFVPHSALVHVDGNTPDLPELLSELADRMETGYLFGGLASGRTRALHMAEGVWAGGLSGVAFDSSVGLVSRVTQGCQPIGPARTVTEADRNVVVSLDGEPALDCLLRDLGHEDGVSQRELLPRLRTTMAGLSDARVADTLARPGQFGNDVRVRHLVGLDPQRRGLAVAEQLEEGMRLTFCSRNPQAARLDLVRIATEIREEIEGDEERPAQHIAGAVYVSCGGRGGPHFGAPHAELQIVRRALGDVPLVGFFAAGEIARHQVYGYTGVLTVFTA